MLNKLNVLTIALTLTATASAFADVVTVGANNKLDLAPLIVVEQALPQAKIGKEANKDNGALSLSVDNGVGVTLPFVNASVKLGTASIGPKGLNATIGNNNSVTVGPLSVGQKLPSANVGTAANKGGWFDIRIKNGIGITLPFVSVDVPYPSLGLASGAPSPARVPAPAKK